VKFKKLGFNAPLKSSIIQSQTDTFDASDSNIALLCNQEQIIPQTGGFRFFTVNLFYHWRGV